MRFQETEIPNQLYKPDKLYGRLLKHEDLPPVVLEVMGTRVFQRLYGVSHGGLKSDAIHKYDFDKIGDSHNRGDHSSSTALLANHMYDESQLELDRVHFVLAALLHDIGHTAYSHLSELAFDLCHKDQTTQIILNDPELVKIWSKHRIDPQVVLETALEKTPGNPVTVKRESGLMSLDHLNNTFFDTYQRLGYIYAQRIAQALLSKTYIENGIIVLSEDEPRLRDDFSRTSVIQNTKIVYNNKDLLLDHLGCQYLRTLVRAGVLAVTDLHKDQASVHRIITSPDAQAQARQEWELLSRGIPNLPNNQLSQFITREPLTDKVVNPEDELTRTVIATYLMTIPFSPSRGPITTPQQFTRIKDNLTGTYKFMPTDQIYEQTVRSTK